MKQLVAFTSCCLLASVTSGWAQGVSTSNGAISGVVSDSTRAVLPGVTVTLSGPAVMGTPTAITDERGFYRFLTLSPGEYTLTFELSGFGRVTQEQVAISLGFTANVNVVLPPAGVSETVNVVGGSPVVDLQSTSVTTHFDSERLASLPGSRDYWAILANAPAVSMSRIDVGGSGALTQQPYTAYGLSSAGGVNRGMVEGMVVNEGSGGAGTEIYYTDYGSFAEVAINAVGNTAEMPNPGVLSQFISKSGGNEYHGNVYLDYQNDSMEAHNISAQQIARGITGSQALAAVDTNRISTFRDFNADVGGFITKDRLWWYAAYRNGITDQRYPTLVDAVQHTAVPTYTGKLTFNVKQNQKLIGYYQHSHKDQPNYLGTVTIPAVEQRFVPALMTADSVYHSGFPVHLGKVEYNGVLTNTVLLEVRAGMYQSVWWRAGAVGPRAASSKSTAHRVEDAGNNSVSGGNFSTDVEHYRPQVNGSLTYSKRGWGVSHDFKLGGEWMRERLVQPFYGFGHPSNSVSLFNNGVPIQVRLYQTNVSENGLSSLGLYANDSWRVNHRLTVISVSAGIDSGYSCRLKQTALPGRVFQPSTARWCGTTTGGLGSGSCSM